MNKKTLSVLLIFGLLAGILSAVVSDDLEKLLKVFGTGFLVDKFGGEIDKFFNTLTANDNVKLDEATKTVPMVAVGSGGYVGAAQVAGPQDKLDEVKAVLVVEGDWKSFRAKALVPIDSKNPLKSFSRVKGVGVSAVLDIEF